MSSSGAVVTPNNNPSSTPAPSNSGSVSWRYIGLYGHSVGTLTLDANALQWKSASTGGSSDLDNSVMTRRVPADQLTAAQWTVFGRSGYLRVQADGSKSSDKKKKKALTSGTELRFDGFPENDQNKLREAFERFYNIDVKRKEVSPSGASFGVTDIHGKLLVFRESIVAEEEGEAESGEEILSLDLTEVSQCVLPGNNRNEIELQFHESDTVEQNTDQLVQVRFYVPPDPDVDPSDRDNPTAAEIFQQRIMSKAQIKSTTGNVIAKFDETQGTFLTPRGRYTIELFDLFLRLRGNKYDYKIKYDDISRLFLLPKPDDLHMAFVIALDKPIRQGQQRYQYLVMQTTKNQSELEIHLDEETLKKEYNGDIQPVMQGSLSNLVAKTFKVITRKKVFVPGKFANASQHACVKCALRANEGHLYPLEKQFIFIHKPSVLIRFDEVESVEFQRYAGGQGSTRNFDLCVMLKSSLDANTADLSGNKEYIFSGIDRSDYATLYNFLSGKKIRIKNLEGVGGPGEGGAGPAALPVPLPGESLYEGGQTITKSGRTVTSTGVAEAAAAMQAAAGGGDDSEESSDADYESGEETSEGEAGGSGESDVSGGGSDIDDMSEGSDIEEMRKKVMKEKMKQQKLKEKAEGGSGSSKKEKKRKADKDDKSVSSSSSSKSKKQKESPTTKKKKPESPKESGAKKKAKPKKDPNAPKKPLTSYLLYSTTMRPQVKKDNPEASFGELAKLISVEYKKLSDAERKTWDEKAAKDKKRYEEEMEEYKKKNPEAAAALASGGKKKKAAAAAAGESKKKKKPVVAKKESSSEEDSSGSDDDSGDSSGSDDESGSGTDSD